jgi:5-deoxy-glucuronate isomerase
MQQYDLHNLLVRSSADPGTDLLVEVTPQLAGWDTLHFQARRLDPGQSWSFDTAGNELALVVLSGCLTVDSNRGRWVSVGSRASVFTGLPAALYLPAHSTFTVTAESDGNKVAVSNKVAGSDNVAGSEFAVAWVAVDPTSRQHPAQLVTPADIAIEIRGGDHATRQINSILPPGFPCARLVVVEVYTPGGNWSSYPPHKHDVHTTAPNGAILEADLDEIYYYKIDRPEGYAIQRVYTDPASPLHQAGFPIDALLMPRNNDVVLVPEGYHPVASPPGYTTYYLNVLAGSAQSLAATDDPAFTWVKSSYRSRDPRVPLYPTSPAKK